MTHYDNLGRMIAAPKTDEKSETEIAHLRQTNAELLAALRRALPQIEFTHLYRQRLMTAADAEEIKETLSQVRAAIAKAKGE